MKREITVEIHGELGEEANREFHKRMAEVLFNQWGPEKTKAILELMKKKQLEKE